MVVAADRTSKRDLASAVQSLETVDAPVAGFALNMVAPTSTAHRYGYYGHTREEGTKLGRSERRARSERAGRAASKA
jgi:Mrp family chromosome partitioning ATPase